MNIYFEVSHHKVFLCNKLSPVRAPVITKTDGMTDEQLDEICKELNRAYRMGYDRAMNRIRAYVDNVQIEYQKAIKRKMN